MSGVATASGTEWRKKKNARRRQISNEDKLQKLEALRILQPLGQDVLALGGGFVEDSDAL
jgi:hypothetical protein